MSRTLAFLLFVALGVSCLNVFADPLGTAFKGTCTVKITANFSAETVKALGEAKDGQYFFGVVKYFEGITRDVLLEGQKKPGTWGKQLDFFDVSYVEKKGKLKFTDFSTYPFSLIFQETSENVTEPLEKLVPYMSVVKCTGTLRNLNAAYLKDHYMSILDFGSGDNELNLLYGKCIIKKQGKNFVSKLSGKNLKINVKLTSKGALTYNLKCNEKFAQPDFMPVEQ